MPNQHETISLGSRAEHHSAIQQELAQIHEERLGKLIELDRREERLKKKAKELAEGQLGPNRRKFSVARIEGLSH
jgi:hypothetical protein